MGLALLFSLGVISSIGTAIKPAYAAPALQLTEFPTPTPGPDGRIIYIVQDGDTLWRIAAVKGNVRAGIGVALLSSFAVASDLASGQLVRIPFPRTPIRRSLSLRHRGKSRLTPAAAAFRDLLVEKQLRPPSPAL